MTTIKLKYTRAQLQKASAELEDLRQANMLMGDEATAQLCLQDRDTAQALLDGQAVNWPQAHSLMAFMHHTVLLDDN